jgi:intein/homing endonuclease
MMSSDGGIGRTVDSGLRFKTVSVKMAYELQLLLQTLGYVSRVTGNREIGFEVYVWGKHQYIKEIGFIPGLKRKFCESVSCNEPHSLKKLDRVPLGVWAMYRRGKYRPKTNKSRRALREIVGDVFDLSVYWLKVKSIERFVGSDLAMDVYVPESNRLCANGFIVHNSITSASDYKEAKVRRVVIQDHQLKS